MSYKTLEVTLDTFRNVLGREYAKTNLDDFGKRMDKNDSIINDETKPFFTFLKGLFLEEPAKLLEKNITSVNKTMLNRI